MIKHLALAGLSLFAFPALANAQQTSTPATEESALCTDRPTKSNFACTVPAGRVQIESDLFNYGRLSTGGSEGETYLFTNPTIKIGLGDSTDAELNLAPYVRIDSRAGGAASSVDGIGDLTMRVKQRLTDPSAAVQIAIIPFVKIPTAPLGIGNREVEGGIIVPANIAIPGGFTLTLVPEVDLLADSLDPSNRHIQLQGVVNLGYAISPTVTLYGELWTAQNYDPSGTVRQYSVDVAIACLAGRNMQLDVGANFGLNETTPDVQAYVGISTRF